MVTGSSKGECKSPSSLPPAAQDSNRRGEVGWLRTIFGAAALGVVLALCGFAFQGKFGVEKTLTSLVMPVGAFWLLLSSWLVQAVFISKPKQWLGPLFVWLALMLFGTSPLPSLLSRQIENSVTPFDPRRDEPLDIVVVLGGGTHDGPWRAQVTGAGDRVVMGAYLYHRGLTKRLVTTGSKSDSSSVSRSPTEQTIEIWTTMQVPSSVILTAEGRNTYEELRSVKELAKDWPGQRIGLLTSATHLPRAVRLAKSVGLEVIPVAAEASKQDEPLRFLDLLPSAGNLERWAKLQHEVIARLVAR